MIAIA